MKHIIFKIAFLSFYSLLLTISNFAYCAEESFADLVEHIPNSTENDDHFLKVLHQQILGLHNIVPGSAEYRRKARIIQAISRSQSTLPKVNWNELRNLKLTDSNDGNINCGIWHAKYLGDDVILKISDVKTAGENNFFLKENMMMMLVNQLGLGARYYGMTMTPKGPALVMSKLAGTNIKTISNKFSPVQIRKLLGRNVFIRFIEIFATLIRGDIYPRDIQIMVTPEGNVHLVDLGGFEIPFLTEVFEPLRYSSKLGHFEIINMLDHYVTLYFTNFRRDTENVYAQTMLRHNIDITYMERRPLFKHQDLTITPQETATTQRLRRLHR